MDKFLKNINHEEVLKLADLVQATDGQVVSKTLAQNKYVSITVFAFSKGEEISIQFMQLRALRCSLL